MTEKIIRTDVNAANKSIYEVLETVREYISENILKSRF